MEERGIERAIRLSSHLLPSSLSLSPSPLSLSPLSSSSSSSLKERLALSLHSFVSAHTPSQSRILISFNACLDLVVSAVSLWTSLRVPNLPHSTGEPADYEQVQSLQEVIRLFSFYHRQGSAVERHVSDGDLFDLLVETAEKQKSALKIAGGNAVLMANALAKKGSSIFLGGPVGSGLRPFLSPSISLPTGTDATEWKDEVHLILEYKKEEEWGGERAPRANRVILTHDVNNIHLSEVMNALERGARAFSPDMLVIAGLHMIEAKDASFREDQILKVFATYEAVAGDRVVPIHAELASMGSHAYWQQMTSLVFPRVHSIGLNEQELYSVYSALGGTEFQFSDFTSPDPGLIIRTIGFVFDGSRSHVLERVHFHCLQFHIVARRLHRNGETLFPRERAAISVCAGALVTTQNAGFDGRQEMFDVTKTDLYLPATIEVPFSISPSASQASHKISRSVSLEQKDSPYYYVSYAEAEFWIVPIFVCKFPKKTVGLGDSISATSLAYAL